MKWNAEIKEIIDNGSKVQRKIGSGSWDNMVKFVINIMVKQDNVSQCSAVVYYSSNINLIILRL